MPPSLIDNPQRARQLARAIASDLTLYHEAKILEGITNDTLFDVMKDEIAEGRALFKSRVTPEIFAQNIFDKRGILSLNTVCVPTICGAYARSYPIKPQMFGVKAGYRY